MRYDLSVKQMYRWTDPGGRRGHSPARSAARGGRRGLLHGRRRPAAHSSVERVGPRPPARGRARRAAARAQPPRHGTDGVRRAGDRSGAGHSQRDRGAAQGPVDVARPRDGSRDVGRRRNRESFAGSGVGRGDAAGRAGAVVAAHRRRVGAPRGRCRRTGARQCRGDRTGRGSAPGRRAPARRRPGRSRALVARVACASRYCSRRSQRTR